MAEKRVPDPTLMARLQLSVKGVDWAASLVRARQHEQPASEWSGHQHLFHLLATERQIFQPRLHRMLTEERPVLAWWDEAEHMRDDYSNEVDIMALADEFMDERAKTVESLKALTPDQWARTATWPDGREVDVAWLAERALAHGLEHFTALLNLHQALEPRHAPAWLDS